MNKFPTDISVNIYLSKLYEYFNIVFYKGEIVYTIWVETNCKWDVSQDFLRSCTNCIFL